MFCMMVEMREVGLLAKSAVFVRGKASARVAGVAGVGFECRPLANSK